MSRAVAPGASGPWWFQWPARGALALGLATVAWWPMLRAYPRTQGGDGPPYQKTLEAAVASVTRYHEFPHWNPYECGGLPLWDNPQAPIGAPLAWTALALGSTAAMALWYVAHSAAGFLAMVVFARHELRLTPLASYVAGAAWAFSGFHAQHYGGGHFTFVGFLYFPLALLLARRSEHDDRAAVGLGLLAAWMFFEGGVYPLPHLALLLGAEMATRARSLPRLARALRGLGLAVAVGALVSAVRLLPVLDQLAAHTRPLAPEHDALSWTTLRDAFFARTHDRDVVGQEYAWPEYGAYLGPALVLLALAGIALGGLEHAWLVALLVLALALAWGHFHPAAPWALLKGHVFPFREMRVPSRFLASVAMALAAFIGVAIDRLPERVSSVAPRAAGAVRSVLLAVALFGLADVIAVGARVIRASFHEIPLASVTASPRLFYATSELAPHIADHPRQNLGRLECWDEWAWGQGAPLWQGDVPQARAADAGARVLAASRTQNTFTLDVEASRPSRILVNSAFDRGWRTDVGALAEERRELVLDVPAGRHRATLRYVPRLFGAGVILTIAGAALAAALVVRARRKKTTPGRSFA